MTHTLYVLIGFSVAVPLAAAGFGWLCDQWMAALDRQWKRLTK